MAYYNNNLIPQWKNSLILAVLKDQRIINMKLFENGTGITTSESNITNGYGRKRAICIAPNGKIYFGTSNGNDDKIIEIRRSN